MRGKERRAEKSALLFGITPAYAGKRFDENAGKQFARDHPRVCGEKMCNVMQKDKSTGSPPRMRGKD